MSKINQINFVDLPRVTVLSGRLFNYVAASINIKSYLTVMQTYFLFNSHANKHLLIYVVRNLSCQTYLILWILKYLESNHTNH